MKKTKMYVTKKEGNRYYFRFYGNSIENSPGTALEIGEECGNLILPKGETLEVGDYVEGKYYEGEGFSYGYRCHKIIPTERDIKANKLAEDYANAIAENVGPFFKDVLEYGKKKILEAGQTKNDLVYSEKQINTLVKQYMTSLKTFGVSGGMGSGLFVFYLQLSSSNIMGHFKEYNKILGTKVTSFDMKDYPTCVPKKYADKIFFSGSCGYTNNDSWPERFSVEFGDVEIIIKCYTNRVEVEKPYVPGSFQVVMDEIISKEDDKPASMELK